VEVQDSADGGIDVAGISACINKSSNDFLFENVVDIQEYLCSKDQRQRCLVLLDHLRIPCELVLSWDRA
jgi:hypothetical protein